MSPSRFLPPLLAVLMLPGCVSTPVRGGKTAAGTAAPMTGTGSGSSHGPSPSTAPGPATGTATPPGSAPPPGTTAGTETTLVAASPAAATPGTTAPATDNASPATGLAIFESFRAGLAEPQCGNAEPRWLAHYAHAPRRLGDADGDTLALFGYVVESLRAADLPAEFALIPFIESGYAPGARSKAGPAGLWQFIAGTGRNHGLRIEPGYDGRLSPAESTRAAVSYLGGLHQRLDGNWRLTLMAYNAGEFRVLQAVRRSGGDVASASPQDLHGLPPLTYAYVEKLHALACLLEEAGAQPRWRAGLDRPVTPLQARSLDDARSLEQWAARHGQDAADLRRLNPALAGHWPRRGAPLALVPATAAAGARDDQATSPDGASPANDVATTYTVRRGDSAWTIAKRHGMRPAHLLELNGLGPKSVLRPGMVLRVD